MVGALTAALTSAAWCALLPIVGPRWGFVDTPDDDGLKVHSTPAVPLAGPGLLLGIAFGLAVMAELQLLEMAGLAVLTAVGVIDDRVRLSPAVRMAVELAAAVLIATRWQDQGLVWAVIGAGLIVVSVNAVNLYDGIDTLAGGSGLVGLGIIGFLAWSSGVPYLLLVVAAAALVGFLPFNRHPARVFLGDGGAYLMGAITAVGIWDVGIGRGGWARIAVIGLLGMFAVDLIVTVLRRLRAREPLFLGDRRHLYDLLVASGISVPGAAARLVALHFLIVGASAAALIVLTPSWAMLCVAIVGVTAVVVGLQMAASAGS